MYRHGEIFRSRVSDKVPDGVVLSFADFRNSLQHSAEWVKKSLRAKNQLDPSNSFDRTSIHLWQTDRQTGLWVVPRLHSVARIEIDYFTLHCITLHYSVTTVSQSFQSLSFWIIAFCRILLGNSLDIGIHRVKWRHRVYGHDTIAILWV